jgi:hypothetical protein
LGVLRGGKISTRIFKKARMPPLIRATTSMSVVMGIRMAKTVGLAPEPLLCVDPAVIPDLSWDRLVFVLS